MATIIEKTPAIVFQESVVATVSHYRSGANAGTSTSAVYTVPLGFIAKLSANLSVWVGANASASSSGYNTSTNSYVYIGGQNFLSTSAYAGPGVTTSSGDSQRGFVFILGPGQTIYTQGSISYSLSPGVTGSTYTGGSISFVGALFKQT